MSLVKYKPIVIPFESQKSKGKEREQNPGVCVWWGGDGGRQEKERKRQNVMRIKINIRAELAESKIFHLGKKDYLSNSPQLLVWAGVYTKAFWNPTYIFSFSPFFFLKVLHNLSLLRSIMR